MPQMAPISWLNLFMVFSISLIMFSTMNYYSLIYQPPKLKINYKFMMNSLIWKW